MFRLYHFTAERPAEDLALGKNHILPGRVARFLTSFQLDGVRFLYKNFIENQGCILNDESGLGKTAVVAVFLHVLLSPDIHKRCLIIVKNEEKMNSWKFHLEVLAKLHTKILRNEKDLETEGVFLITWDVLRKSSSIAHTLFNCVILDDRDELTSSKICMNYFLRNYEKKISLIVATTDVTLDIKQFHGMLKLTGHLDKKYEKLSVFEDKFSLPKAISGKPEDKNLLEAYFQRREKIINFCRDYRLRRYRHQFEDMLPLVASSTSAKSLAEWKEQGMTKSLSSSGSVKIVSSSSDKDTEELFQTYFDVKSERSTDNEVAKINKNAGKKATEKDTHDTVEMSPLLFESDSEDVLEVPILSDKSEKNIEEKHDTNVEMKKESPLRGRRRKTKSIKTERTHLLRSDQKATRSRTQQRKYLLLDVSRTENTSEKKKRRTRLSDKSTKMECKGVTSPKTVKETVSIVGDKIKKTQKTPEPDTKRKTRTSSESEVRNTRSKSETPKPTTSKLTTPSRKRPKSCEPSKSKKTPGRKRKKIKEKPCEPPKSDSSSEVIVKDTDENRFPAEKPLPIVSESPLSSSYNFNLDYLNKQFPSQKNNSSEIHFLSPQNQVIIITSSNECSNPPLSGNSKHHQASDKVSPSPDIFDNFDDYDFLCTQKGKGTSFGGFKMFGKGIKESQNAQKQKTPSSCLDSLEKEYRSHQAPIADTDDMNIFEITTNETFGNLLRINSSGVDLSPIKMRSNAFQHNKITKYLIGGEISSQSIDSTQSHEISDRRRSSDGYPKTPKRQTTSQRGSLTTGALSKRSPKLMGPPRNFGVTPTGLTKWLIKPTGSPTKTTKRRRLDLWFKD